MKFFILITLLLSAALIDAKRLRKKHHTHHRRENNKQASKNCFYQFLLGTLSTFGGNPKFIDECSQNVPGWEAAGQTEEKSNSMGTEMGQQNKIYAAAIKIIKKAVDIICDFKTDIVNWLVKQTRRYFRLFLSGKTQRRRMSWGIGSLISAVGDGIKKAASAVSSGISKIKDKVVEGKKWVGQKIDDITSFIKTQLEEWFKPVFDMIDKLKAKVKAFLEKHPFLMNLLLFAKCFIQNKGVKTIKNLYNTFMKFIAFIPQLATVAGWIRLVANIICEHETVAEIIDLVKKAIAATDPPIRYNTFGKAMGLMLKIIATS